MTARACPSELVVDAGDQRRTFACQSPAGHHGDHESYVLGVNRAACLRWPW